MTTYLSPSVVTPRKTIFHKIPLAAFFVLVFALTWPFLIVDALGSHGVLPFRLPLPLLLLMGYMPTCAALVVTGITQGRKGIRSWLGKLAIWQVSWKWYAFAIFGFAGFCIATILIYNLFAGPDALPILAADTPHFSSPLEMVLNIALLFLVTALVNGEELAWRGFALPRLQARWSALTSSLILGVIWTLFHLPLFFTLRGSSQAGMSFASFMVSTVSLTVLYTWMYNHTQGSVLMAYLLHASANTWTRVFSIQPVNGLQSWIMAGLILVVAVVVVWREGKQALSRRGQAVSSLSSSTLARSASSTPAMD